MKVLYGLPKNVEFCSECVISNQRPSSSIEFKNKNQNKKTIVFNKDKICSACEFNKKKNTKIDWIKREKELVKLCSQIKKQNKNSLYDCVVPGSGGKDSAYTAHILKYKYGLNPLTVTWAPHLYTEIGRKNLENWSHVGGLDNILFTPNGILHRKITSYAFKNLLHPFQPFIIGQRLIGPYIANKFNIKNVFYGENQAEYGNSIKENKISEMKDNFFSEKKITLNNTFLGGEQISEIIKKDKFKMNDFAPYIPLSKNELNKKKIKVHYLGYFLKWDPQECYYYASQNTGFKSNEVRTEGSYSKYSSIDDKIDTFHYYTTLIKFGIGRATYDASQEIRNGKITRDEGIKLVDLYDQEFPSKYFNDFLNYIDINKDDFFKIINKFRSPHLWAKKNNKWLLRHTVSKKGTDD